jgi:hypothetical protein
MKVAVFWVETLRSLTESYEDFREIHCLHLQGMITEEGTSSSETVLNTSTGQH